MDTEIAPPVFSVAVEAWRQEGGHEWQTRLLVPSRAEELLGWKWKWKTESDGFAFFENTLDQWFRCFCLNITLDQGYIFLEM